MALRLGDQAPDFKQDSTEGNISFHEWAGKEWVVLFSHPKDFTPVCTTELGEVARLKKDFEKRNCKVIALSVDSVDDHKKWSQDIAETQDQKVNFPIRSLCKTRYKLISHASINMPLFSFPINKITIPIMRKIKSRFVMFTDNFLKNPESVLTPCSLLSSKNPQYPIICSKEKYDMGTDPTKS